MRQTIRLILLLITLLLPAAALAMPCHCFSEREYDPGQPAAADPYFLTTTENSFFALVNGLKKSDVVLAKQKPAITSEGLWIAYWLAENTGAETKILLRARAKNSSWATALAALTVDSRKLPAAAKEHLDADPDDQSMAKFVIDTILEERKVIAREDLQRLREMGADNQQTILAALLARKTGNHAIEFLNAVRTGQRSWGTHLLKAEMNGNEMEAEIAKLLFAAHN